MKSNLGRRFRLAFGAALAALVFLSGPRLTAQTAGSVSGHLADPAGANLAQTDVTLTNVDTSASRATKSTDAGDYTFTEVQPGNYKLQVQHAGFKTTTSESFEVQVAQSVKLDLTLQVGAVTESVDVQASGTLLQAEDSSLGTVVENKAINELPLNGRNYLSLVALSSNVNTLSPAAGQAGSRLGGDRASQSIAVGGQRIMFDYYTLDGVDNTDPDFVTYLGLPSLDGIAEFKVQTGVYTAEYGHEASQINVVSKSGTNTYHGAAYEFIRNNHVDALPYQFPFNSPVGLAPYKWNDFGFELDGPIRIPKIYNGKDKFFFMTDAEWYRSRSDNPNNFSYVLPTPAEAAGNFQNDFYQWEDTTGAVHNAPVIIYDPTTHLPEPNNTLPSVSPVSTALIKYLGTAATAPTFLCPTTAPTKDTNCSAVTNGRYTSLNNSNRYSITFRGDYNMSQKSQLSFRYTSGSENTLGVGLLGAGSKLVTNYHQYMGSNTYTFSPSLVNEVRFGYTYLFNSLAPLQSFVKDVVDSLGIPGLTNPAPAEWGIPSMSFGNGPNSGVNSSGVFGTTPNRLDQFWRSGRRYPVCHHRPNLADRRQRHVGER